MKNEILEKIRMMDKTQDGPMDEVVEKLESLFDDLYEHGYRLGDTVFGEFTFEDLQTILHVLHEASGKEYDDNEWRGAKYK